MTQEHPITPPPELVQQWRKSGPADAAVNNAYECHIAIQAAQWGADQELEACLDQLQRWGIQGVDNLRNTRRPKPPSLKEQALKALDHILNNSSTDLGGNTIRRALEQLPDHEPSGNSR
jgi:hypothetical protein